MTWRDSSRWKSLDEKGNGDRPDVLSLCYGNSVLNDIHGHDFLKTICLPSQMILTLSHGFQTCMNCQHSISQDTC